MTTSKSSALDTVDTVSLERIAELSAAALVAARNDPNVNPRGLINAELIKEQKARVRYKNGITLPTAASVLLANAARQDYNHRRRLSGNIVAASKQARPSQACAHHIVALLAAGAARSRMLLFRWGIGINDADNGVFLPAKQVGLPGHPAAAHHTPHHDAKYHFEVFFRLNLRNNEADARTELRGMKSDLLAGRMSL
jgi:hypothetical protein